MAEGKLMMGVVLVVMSMLYAGATAQSSSSCTDELLNLIPCLSYINGNSSSIPSPDCCSNLSAVVKSQPLCLCPVLDGGGIIFGVIINQTHALTLPAACNVHTPPISRCNVAPPAGSPKPAPPAPRTESPNSDPGTESKTVPTTHDASSGGNSINISIPLLISVFAATYASTFITY